MPARRAPDRLAPVATSGVSQSYRAESVRLYGGERPRFGIRQPASFQRLAPWLQPHGAPIFSRFLATFRIGGRGGTRTRVVRLMRPGWNLLQLPCHVCPARSGAPVAYSTISQSSARMSLWEASHIWKLPSTHFIWRYGRTLNSVPSGMPTASAVFLLQGIPSG